MTGNAHLLYTWPKTHRALRVNCVRCPSALWLWTARAASARARVAEFVDHRRRSKLYKIHTYIACVCVYTINTQHHTHTHADNALVHPIHIHIYYIYAKGRMARTKRDDAMMHLKQCMSPRMCYGAKRTNRTARARARGITVTSARQSTLATRNNRRRRRVRVMVVPRFFVFFYIFFF